MTVKANGVPLHIIVDGPENAPAITFSNSLMTDTHLWELQARALSKRFRIIRYDQRGHGGSPASRAPYGFDELADDIIGIWDHLGIAQSHLVGLSMGGMTALGLALRAPERLLSCTMCSMRADAPVPFQRSWDERIALATEQGMAALAEPTVNRWFPPHFEEDAVRATVNKMVATTPVAGFLGGVNAICSLDYADRIHTLRGRIQYLAGENDGVLPQAMEKLALQTRGSRYCAFPGAGHLINLERPSEFNAAIEEFVDRPH